MSHDEKQDSPGPNGGLAKDAARHSDKTVKLPRPTPDQEKYLSDINRSGKEYDPDTIVGGPQRT